MKGVVFTELMELVESKFGLEVVDQILTDSELPSGGVYTAVGTYEHTEIVELVTQLSKTTGLPAGDLINAFGHHLFYKFVGNYQTILSGIDSSIKLFSSVENFIHVEVKKLYPEAQLPHLDFNQLSDNTWQLVYTSQRPFADLAQGLIEACIEHFQDDVDVQREDLPVEAGAKAKFTLVYNKQPNDSKATPCENLAQ